MLIEHKTSYHLDSNFIDCPENYSFFLTKTDLLTDYQLIKLINSLGEKALFSEITIVEDQIGFETIYVESFKTPIYYEDYADSFSFNSDFFDERTVYFEDRKMILKELKEEELIVVAVDNKLLGVIENILSSFFFKKTEDFLTINSAFFSEKDYDKFIYLYGDTPHFYYKAPDSKLKLKINSAKRKYKKIKEFSVWKRVIATVVSILISIPFLSYVTDRFGLDSFILELIAIAGIFFLVSLIMLYFDEKKDR